MAVDIDARAVIGKNVEFGANVSIAPYVFIEDNVFIGDNTTIGAGAYIGENTTIGRDCKISNNTTVGTIAQDLKYGGEEAFLIIGDRAIIREYCTINRGTVANDGYTRIGDDLALLAYGHVGHDSEIGNKFTASNGLAMAGHVKVGDNVICGGNVSIHQFTSIGSHSFIGANSYVTMDIVPYALVGNDGTSPFISSVNKIGLERRGFSKEELSNLKSAYKILFRSGLTLDEAKKSLNSNEELTKNILNFMEISKRGLLRVRK